MEKIPDDPIVASLLRWGVPPWMREGPDRGEDDEYEYDDGGDECDDYGDEYDEYDEYGEYDEDDD